MLIGSKLLKYMVPPTRFERAAYGLGIHCSILLSYGGGEYCGISHFLDW